MQTESWILQKLPRILPLKIMRLNEKLGERRQKRWKCGAKGEWEKDKVVGLRGRHSIKWRTNLTSCIFYSSFLWLAVKSPLPNALAVWMSSPMMSENTLQKRKSTWLLLSGVDWCWLFNKGGQPWWRWLCLFSCILQWQTESLLPCTLWSLYLPTAIYMAWIGSNMPSPWWHWLLVNKTTASQHEGPWFKSWFDSGGFYASPPSKNMHF